MALTILRGLGCADDTLLCSIVLCRVTVSEFLDCVLLCINDLFRFLASYSASTAYFFIYVALFKLM